jgi:hypothetical protein
LAVAPDLRPVQASNSAAATSNAPEELLATEHNIQLSNALAEVGLRQYLVNVLVGDVMVLSSGVEGGRLYIGGIPMSRKLEMAVCQEMLPDIHVGKCTTDLGAWMAFLWDRHGS